MPDFDITDNEDRFRFELDTKLIGRTIIGIKVSRDAVELFFEGGGGCRFKTEGDDIIVGLPMDSTVTTETETIQ